MEVITRRDLEQLGRHQYHPSNRVDWDRVLPRLAVGIVGAIALAAVLWYTYSIGKMYILVNALLAAFAGWLIAMWIVRQGHCRSPKIAARLGLLIGLITYWGFLQAQLIQVGGWQMVYRIDLLPGLVWHNWNTQQFQFKDIGGAFEFQFIGNIVVFWLELVLTIGLPAAAADLTARRVYSEETQQWAKSAVVIAHPDVAAAVRVAIQSNQLAEILPQIQPIPVPNPQKPPPRCALALEYTNGDGSFGYLSVHHIAFFSHRIVYQLLLSPEEFEACRSLFHMR